MKKNAAQFTYTVSGQDGQELPGLNLAEMRRRITTGEINGASFVRRSDTEHWATASDFSELAVKDVVVGRYDHESGPDPLTKEMEEAGYARRIRTGAGWFFWIAAMSSINTILAFVGSGWHYALGLSISAPIGVLGVLLGGKVPVIALAINLALVLAFVYFGVAGWKKRLFPYVIGMGLYAGDTLGAYLVDDWLSVGLHVLALFYLFLGLKAHLRRRELKIGVKVLTPFFVSLALLAGGGFLLNLRLEPPQKEAAGAEAWARKPHKEWPALVLSHDAEFRGHSALLGGSAFLVQLSEHEIIAVTAKHLLGANGGVAPPLRAGEVNEAIEKWRLHPRASATNAIEVTGLFGRPNHYRAADDTVLLQVDAPENLPATALKMRYKPLEYGETVYVIGVRYDNAKQEQEVFPAKVTSSSKGTVEGDLKLPANLNGFSGAPIVDASGHVVGFVTGSRSPADKNGKYADFVGRNMEEMSRLLLAAALSR